MCLYFSNICSRSFSLVLVALLALELIARQSWICGVNNSVLNELNMLKMVRALWQHEGEEEETGRPSFSYSRWLWCYCGVGGISVLMFQTAKLSYFVITCKYCKIEPNTFWSPLLLKLSRNVKYYWSRQVAPPTSSWGLLWCSGPADRPRVCVSKCLNTFVDSNCKVGPDWSMRAERRK